MITNVPTKEQQKDYLHGIQHYKEGLNKLFPENKYYALGYENAKARTQLKEMGVRNGV